MDSPVEELDPRKLVAAELAKDSPDWVLIEQLTRKIVGQDDSRVRFTVDAGHIQRLGMELVGKQETAVSELIKNAYDADATFVSLDFSNAAKRGGSLVIKDDGIGMSEDIIRSSWMRISTTAKAEEPLSPFYGRRRAGRKGIGRFSAQRLGEALTLESNPRGANEGFRVQFLWDEDFGSGTDLNDVFSSLSRFPKKPETSGTSLTISHLRDGYPAASLERIWRSVVLLQSPHKVAPVQGKIADPGFQVLINGTPRDAKSKQLSIEATFNSQALAEIEAYIEEDGSAWAKVTSAKLGIEERHEYGRKFLTTGPIHLKANYFIYAANLLSGMNMKDAAEMGRMHGGIRVYRNGFRVLPYGEEANDWLRVDIDAARRAFLFPANNRNFFGRVELDSVNNPLFEETSSREGLLENDVFIELRQFTREAIEWAAQRIAEIRQRKTRADQRGFQSLVRPSEVIREIKDNLKENPSNETNFVPKIVQQLEQAEVRMIAFEADVEEREAASLEYENMLRLLASLGLSISVFGHEVSGAREAAAAYLMVLGKRIQSLPDEFKAALSPLNTDLGQSINRLFDIGAYISGLTSSTESRELHTQSILGSVQRFTGQFAEYMSKQQVEFIVDIDPPHLRTMPMHTSELDAVLLNFLTNSVKSMKRAKVAERKVKIDARADGRHVVIGFEDNGVGIPQEIRSRIFNAFFTTTVGNDDDSVMGPGTGLGLKIVSDISESYGGWTEVADPSDGYSARLEFRVNSDTGKDL